MSTFQPVTVKLRDDHGNVTDMVLPGPGGTIRFVVGQSGQQSSVWRVWADPGNSNVYLAVRTIIGYLKWSLHESNKWRHAWVDDEEALRTAEELGHTGDRAFDKWDRPDEIGDTGITRGLAIRVRPQDLVTVTQPEKVPAKALWIDPPPAGYTACVDVLLGRPTQPGGVIDQPGLVPFAGFTLENGQAVLLIAALRPLHEHHSAVIANALNIVVDKARKAGEDMTKDNRRAIIGTDNADGDKLVWDMAIPPE
jgi:hypothetical protein